MVLEILAQFTLILIAGIVLKAAGDRLNFPYIVFLLLAGTALASWGLVRVDLMQNLPELIRTLALIIIVFSSGFYIKIKEITKESWSLLSLASIGVIITALVIAGTAFWLLSLPLIAAALFGALLCGTDPAAICGEDLCRPSRVLTILRTESVLNQPLTIILPFFILDYLQRTQATDQVFLWILGVNVFKLVMLAVVGTLVGFIAFKIGKYLLKHVKAHNEALGLAIAITSYVVAELLGGSGILAVAVCSIFLSSVRLPEKKWLGQFHNELAFIFTILVFILLGAEFLFSDFLYITRLDVIAVIIALVLGRLIASFISLSGSDLTLKERIQVGLIAPKGVAPAALAPLLLIPAYGIIDAQKIVIITYIAIVFSILLSLVLMQVFYKERGAKVVVAKS